MLNSFNVRLCFNVRMQMLLRREPLFYVRACTHNTFVLNTDNLSPKKMDCLMANVLCPFEFKSEVTSYLCEPLRILSTYLIDRITTPIRFRKIHSNHRFLEILEIIVNSVNQRCLTTYVTCLSSALNTIVHFDLVSNAIHTIGAARRGVKVFT
jgi:hypothetical protein